MNSIIEVNRSEGLPRDRIVRRYLDPAKFLDLLRSRTIYLSRADCFADRFEGALTPAFRKSFDAWHKVGASPYDADEYSRRARWGNYVSCWSIGAHDNMALWHMYGGAANSVAITSTVGALVDVAVQWQRPNVAIRKVRYIDHFMNPDMILGPFADLLEFKHKAYKYEAELRIIVPDQSEDPKGSPKGIRLPVDLNRLVRSVVVAPESADWFYDLVADITAKYGVTKPVRRSKLTYLPK